MGHWARLATESYIRSAAATRLHQIHSSRGCHCGHVLLILALLFSRGPSFAPSILTRKQQACVDSSHFSPSCRPDRFLGAAVPSKLYVRKGFSFQRSLSGNSPPLVCSKQSSLTPTPHHVAYNSSVCGTDKLIGPNSL